MFLISLLTTFSLAAATGPQTDAPHHRTDRIVIYHDRQHHESNVDEQEVVQTAEMSAVRVNYADQPYDSLLVAVRNRRIAQSQDEFVRQFINLDANESRSAAGLPDSLLSARLRTIMSPIDMSYNDAVRRHIVAYTTSRRSIMERILERSQYYFPLIEQELDAQGLPVELRMLAAIESALAPDAVSRSGAAGLWQFVHSTGKLYGLEINSYVDQRRDPLLSTRAACRYLKDLYKIYGDWTLVLAAYNCGPGNVNKAVKRAGGNISTFWDIYDFLPRETRDYVPSFIAATYAFKFYREHGLTKRPVEIPLTTDTITINRPLHFEQICSTINIPTDVLRMLNPQYKSDIVPATDRSYSLTLPQSEVGRFLENEALIHSKDSLYMAQYVKPAATSATQQSAQTFSSVTTYKVKSGDTLGSIAKRYNVSVKQLMKWNKLANANKLKVGQKLEIHR